MLSQPRQSVKNPVPAWYFKPLIKLETVLNTDKWLCLRMFSFSEITKKLKLLSVSLLENVPSEKKFFQNILCVS